MTAKSYFIEYKGNKYPNSPESGSGKVCAVKKIGTGEWLKKFGEQDLDIANVLYVCSSNCKKCDFNPKERSCTGDGTQAMTMVYGAELTVQVRDESDRGVY
ncbi:MAG: hypothetical protein KAQ71_13815 [Desulfobulbaceae bacterium]|nr:hypothetical protein [Desulfobulbaceae bacterium]